MSLFHLYTVLAKLEEQVRRLQACKVELQGCQQEFFQNEGMVTKPELTATTWAGNLADIFDDIRQLGMLVSYKDIEHQQFEDVYSAIDTKIAQLKQEIESVKAAIARLEAEMAAEKAKNK